LWEHVCSGWTKNQNAGKVQLVKSIEHESDWSATKRGFFCAIYGGICVALLCYLVDNEPWFEKCDIFFVKFYKNL
jgi:hypothetical protein